MKKRTKKNLTAEQLETLKENAIGILSNVRKKLLDRYPFYGTIAMSLELVPVRDYRIDTMCTDGTAIYCDIDFLKNLNDDDKMFVLAHEILHNVMLHFVRREEREHKIFNIATDIEVNNILALDGFSVPKDACTAKYFHLPEGRAAEEYYDLLLKQKQNNNDFNSGANSNSSRTFGSSKYSGQFDKHIYENDELPENPEGQREDSYGNVGVDEDFRPVVTKSSVEKVRETAVVASQVVERQYGTLPAHLKKMIADLLEPKLDWREMLCKYVVRIQGIKRTWTRPNRRFVSSGIYLPSSYGDKIKVGLVIDTSGSVYNYVKTFISELYGIVKQFEGYEITVVQCDMKVQNVKTFTDEDPFDFEHEKFEMHGFGGTDLTPGLKYFENNETNIDCIICLTDGEFGRIAKKDEPALPVLWVLTKNGTDDDITFGETCWLD